MKRFIKALMWIIAPFPVIVAAVLLFFYGGDLEDPYAPDIVIYNGRIITMDESIPRPQAVALSGGRIVYVGEFSDAVGKVSPYARRIDLAGRALIPGFNDNHTHTFAAGIFYEKPLLWGKTCREIAEIVKAEAEKRRPGEMIIGNAWDYTTCQKPHRSILDDAAPGNPVFLIQYSGHAAWVNSMQLRDMGIDRHTPDPRGGQIMRDGEGEPTGILRDTAMGEDAYAAYARNLLIPDKHRHIIDTMLQRYHEAGITSVQDNTWEPLTVRMLGNYLKEGALTCRFSCWPYGETIGASHLMRLPGYYENWIAGGPVKFFADGAFSTRTAWLLNRGYADEPGNLGRPRHLDRDVGQIVMEAARCRRQISFHAIGDGAVKQVLDAVEKAADKYPLTARLRIRLEHVQLVAPDDIPRMKRLGVIACIQPFALCSPGKDVTLLGPERARRAYPFRDLLEAGVPVSFGSDVPAEVDYNPLLSIYYAVTRQNREGTEGPLNPGQCLTPYEALYCYTMGSAYAEFTEDKKGSISTGKLADLAVLSEDPLSVSRRRIKDIQVIMTVVGGRVVYERK